MVAVELRRQLEQLRRDALQAENEAMRGRSSCSRRERGAAEAADGHNEKRVGRPARRGEIQD